MKLIKNDPKNPFVSTNFNKKMAHHINGQISAPTTAGGKIMLQGGGSFNSNFSPSNYSNRIKLADQMHDMDNTMG